MFQPILNYGVLFSELFLLVVVSFFLGMIAVAVMFGVKAWLTRGLEY